MASRESRNAVKIENWRVSRVPINPAETILQGDMLAWVDGTTKQATKCAATSGNNFMGVADSKNPIEAVGVLSSDFTVSRMNVIQRGLVEMIAGESMLLKANDLLTVGADAQTVTKTNATASNSVGAADSSYGSAGKQLSAGDYVLLWISPKAFDVVE